MNADEAVDRRLFVAHHHPGRLRVRSVAFEREAALRDTVADWLSAQPGVGSVEAQGQTGSVLVQYDPSAVHAGDLLVRIADQAHLSIAAAEPPADVAQTIFDAAHAADDFVHHWSGGRFGLGVVVPVALGVGSVGSFLFSEHRRIPRWDNLLYWGVQFFLTFNEDAHPRRTDGANGG